MTPEQLNEVRGMFYNLLINQSVIAAALSTVTNGKIEKVLLEHSAAMLDQARSLKSLIESSKND